MHHNKNTSFHLCFHCSKVSIFTNKLIFTTALSAVGGRKVSSQLYQSVDDIL